MGCENTKPGYGENEIGHLEMRRNNKKADKIIGRVSQTFTIT
jgi:hypothetical protein